MPFTIEDFKEFQKRLIREDKDRLGIDEKLLSNLTNKELENSDISPNPFYCDESKQSNKTNLKKEDNFMIDLTSINLNHNVSVGERLNLSCNEGSLEKKKQSFIDKLINSENPLTFRSDGSTCTMLRYGEYSPNNPLLRVSTAPYLGLGEYEQRRQLLVKQRQEDYKEHINQKNEQIKNTVRNISDYKCNLSNYTKSVQTDIQNINSKLIQYDVDDIYHRKSSSASANSNKENYDIYSKPNANVQRIDQRLTTIQNQLVTDMDKPRSILSNRRTETSREPLVSDYNHRHMTTCLDGFSYQDKYDELRRERLKRENYHQELQNQIDEKQRLTELRQQQERMAQERENKRLEEQLKRIQEEQLKDTHRKATREEQIRRNAEEFLRRKQEMQVQPGYRKRLESDSNSSCLRHTKVPLYSPPICRRYIPIYSAPSSSSYPETSSKYGSNRYSNLCSRRDALNRMDLLNTNDGYDTRRDYNQFNRFNSLSRIDSLNQDALNRLETLSISDKVQRRHSATQPELNIRRSPRMQRRSSSSRLEDPLPAPIMKAHSPVARELRNSVAVNSSRFTSNNIRKGEEQGQIAAFQNNAADYGGVLSDGHGRSILSQLGAIRLQLQREQHRMDETLRQRGTSQMKSINFH